MVPPKAEKCPRCGHALRAPPPPRIKKREPGVFGKAAVASLASLIIILFVAFRERPQDVDAREWTEVRAEAETSQGRSIDWAIVVEELADLGGEQWVRGSVSDHPEKRLEFLVARGVQVQGELLVGKDARLVGRVDGVAPTGTVLVHAVRIRVR